MARKRWWWWGLGRGVCKVFCGSWSATVALSVFPGTMLFGDIKEERGRWVTAGLRAESLPQEVIPTRYQVACKCCVQQDVLGGYVGAVVLYIYLNIKKILEVFAPCSERT